jgi:hypothetical protein
MIRVFPKQTSWTPTDDLAFFGMPPLFRPPEQPVRISVVFTWDIPDALRLKKAWSAHYSDVQVGGPAFDAAGGQFVAERFIKKGVTITSRGCVRNCPWCFVPKREGKILELDIVPGHIVQDNNLLACSKSHIVKVFDMLERQNRLISFNGGLDVRLLKQWHIEQLNRIKIDQLFFACDSPLDLPDLADAAELLKDIPQKKKRCYTMIGYGEETLEEAELRLRTVYDLDFTPFCQLYRPPSWSVTEEEEEVHYSDQWKALARLWSRPVIILSKKKEVSFRVSEETLQLFPEE